MEVLSVVENFDVVCAGHDHDVMDATLAVGARDLPTVNTAAADD